MAPSPEEQSQVNSSPRDTVGFCPHPDHCLFTVLIRQQQWWKEKPTYSRLQYRYMDTIMAASWWERNRKR